MSKKDPRRCKLVTTGFREEELHSWKFMQSGILVWNMKMRHIITVLFQISFYAVLDKIVRYTVNFILNFVIILTKKLNIISKKDFRLVNVRSMTMIAISWYALYNDIMGQTYLRLPLPIVLSVLFY